MKPGLLYLGYAFLLLSLLISSCGQRTDPEPFQPDWESMKQFEVPEWFRDAKFGIYFHWGVYSVPAHKNEWYSHYMYVEDHPIRKYHENTYGPLDEFGYKDFIPQFTADNFDPDDWAKLFKHAGARFAGPVTEHADGFAMWDSKLTRYDAKDMGPRRDVVGELEKAIRGQDLKFITTFHHQWLFGWYPTWDASMGTADPEHEDLYGPVVPPTAWVMAREEPVPMPDQKFNERWYSRVREVIDKYYPDLIYFDNKLDLIEEEIRLDFLSYYYNQGVDRDQEVMVTYKFEDLKPWAGVLDLERARMSELKSFPWLTDDSVDWGTWCHVSDPDYKSANRLIDFLVDVVSKNGCVLLNITPTALGEIPEPVRERLIAIGNWLEINGEAIYGTRPWRVYGEGPTKVVEGHLSERKNADNTSEDIRFTQKDGILYAICLDIPETETLHISSLGTGSGNIPGTVISINLLGDDQDISWERTGEGLQIHLERIPKLKYALSFRIEIEDGS